MGSPKEGGTAVLIRVHALEETHLGVVGGRCHFG